MLIRAATSGDSDAIWRMLKPVFRGGDTYAIDSDITSDAALAYWCAPDKWTYVAQDGEDVAGTYYLVRNFGGGGAHVCNCGFVTSPASRGRGTASKMLNHALSEAARKGFRAMQFNSVVETNTGAIRLWERAGFETVGRLPGAFNHPHVGYVDALVMYRKLDDQVP